MLKFSNPNAEKVVKPPQKPVISNNFRVSLSELFLDIYPTRIPIIKQPIILTKRVWYGKLENDFLETIQWTKYLKTLPVAPPIATNNIFFIMVI